MYSKHISWTKTAALTLLLGALARPTLAATINLDKCTTITKPGSYKLTRDLAAHGDCFGVFVDAGKVTLDLGGHTLLGDGTGDGVVFAGAFTTFGHKVLNGVIKGFEDGVLFSRSAPGGIVKNLRLESNTRAGIEAHIGARIQGNTLVNNGSGVSVESGAFIDSNTLQNNGHGIFAGAGGTITNNIVTGSDSLGIQVAQRGSEVADNTTLANGGDGIDVLCPSRVRDNQIGLNNQGELIHTRGDFCTIEDNIFVLE